MTKRKTIEEYYKECKQLGYDLPIKGEKYRNNKTKIKHICNGCGYVYMQLPSSHLRGCGCPKCRGKFKKTTQQYIEECKQLGIDLPIENYVNSYTKIKHTCNNCGKLYNQTPREHMRGQGCPKCRGKFKKTTQQYIEECKVNNLDIPIEDYIDSQTPIKHRCGKCGNIYLQAPYYRLHYGCGCPECKQSQGERFTQNYLDKHNIPYETQKKFNDLKDKTYLSYDFYLTKQNVLIEYQGLQHFENGKGYMNRQGRLEKQQYHDKLKREYAINNGYTLLEPTYKLDNQEKVNEYLDKHLKL